MRKIALVAWREYMDNVRTKGFWIGILAFPLLISLGATVPVLLTQAKEARTYAVLDQSGFVLAEVEKRILAEDLRQVLAAAAERYRDGGKAWDRLPEVVQQAGRLYVGLAEAKRPALVAALAVIEADAELPLEVAAKVPELAGGLAVWWRQVSAEALDELDLELSRSRYARTVIADAGNNQAALNEMVNEGELFAYFVIAADPVASDEGCKYISLNLTDRDLRDWYGRWVSQVVRARRLEREGLDGEVVSWLQGSVHFDARKVDKRGSEVEVSFVDTARQWAPIAFVYLLWIAVFTNSQALLTNTIEEKSTRVIEVLLSSVSPFELMAGKIGGMAAAGLTVVGTWAICIGVALVAVPEVLGAEDTSFGGIFIHPLYLLSFVFYFFSGYLLYASLLVAIGSVCNSLKEAQNLMLPIMIPLMVPLLAMMSISQDPNGTMARVMSFIPLFTPFVMMNRAAGPPPLWEYLATTALMLVSIYLAVRGAGKVFRLGILMTGKPPRLREIAGWLTLKEDVNPAERDGD